MAEQQQTLVQHRIGELEKEYKHLDKIIRTHDNRITVVETSYAAGMAEINRNLDRVFTELATLKTSVNTDMHSQVTASDDRVWSVVKLVAPYGGIVLAFLLGATLN